MVLEKEVNAAVEELKVWLISQKHLPQTMCKSCLLLYLTKGLFYYQLFAVTLNLKGSGGESTIHLLFLETKTNGNSMALSVYQFKFNSPFGGWWAFASDYSYRGRGYIFNSTCENSFDQFLLLYSAESLLPIRFAEFGPRSDQYAKHDHEFSVPVRSC